MRSKPSAASSPAPTAEPGFGMSDCRRRSGMDACLFAASALLNALFLVSDWRFFGEPHFWLAVPARLTVVAASLACFAVIRRAGTFQAAQRTMVAWEGVTALAVALLVSSRSEIALIAALML